MTTDKPKNRLVKPLVSIDIRVPITVPSSNGTIINKDVFLNALEQYGNVARFSHRCLIGFINYDNIRAKNDPVFRIKDVKLCDNLQIIGLVSDKYNSMYHDMLRGLKLSAVPLLAIPLCGLEYNNNDSRSIKHIYKIEKMVLEFDNMNGLNLNEARIKIKSAGMNRVRVVPMDWNSMNGDHQIEIRHDDGWHTVAYGMSKLTAESIVNQALNNVICG